MKGLIRTAFLCLGIAALYLSGIISNNTLIENEPASILVNSETKSTDSTRISAEKPASKKAETPASSPNMALAMPSTGKVPFKNGNVTIEYNLSTGAADFYSQDKKIISGFYSAVKLPQLVTSMDYTSRAVTEKDKVYTVTLRGTDHPVMRQIFDLTSHDYFTVSVEVEGKNLSSNWMAPIAVNSKSAVSIGNYKDVMALWIPFDNDKDVKYNASSINKQDTSYEAAAFYDNSSRNGLVIGSVTHDTWKTGIDYKGNSNKLDLLTVYGGVSINSSLHNDMNRDVQEHGYISGNVIASPKIFAGFFTDWRNGMEAYGDANAKVAPKLQWDGGVVFGWNSWGAVADELDTNNALAASSFIKDSLMDQSFENNGTAYINLDSYWDNPSMDLEEFVKSVHENGQKAGIYWGPFVDWYRDPNRMVEGTNFRYKDIWLKDKNGNPITYGNGPYALDPTHPGTLKRIDFYMGYFKQKGFDAFIKLDFLTFAALEGQHYDKTVTTGMQAINKGMQYLTNSIQNTMGPETFISEAISPLFPYQYAHSRRISCDKFGFLSESKDELNSLAYGWWMSGRIYSYTDPDHVVLYKPWWSDSKISDNEAKTRVTSAVISGTVFLSGDDFTNSDAQARALKYLTNPNINNIARLGKAFRAMEGNTGSSAPDVFTLNSSNEYYIAVFNWDGSNSATKNIDLKRAGLDPKKNYTVVEQWSNASSQVSGSLTVTLEPGEAKIFLLK